VTPYINLKQSIQAKGYKDLEEHGCMELSYIPIEQITRYILLAESLINYGTENEIKNSNLTDGKATLLYGESGSGKSEAINAFNYWY